MSQSQSILDTIRDVASAQFNMPVHALTAATRIDDISERDEIKVIEFIMKIEQACRCDLPDYEITTTATLGQLALLVEKHEGKRWA